ncbi:MAG: hypothetical protein KGD72_02345 [Candidatus Lokiarchaeota archaeon]|nr:hypothetical protein [Candidatus Lokiarchaeota archaeon]
MWYHLYEFPDDKVIESMIALSKRFGFYASIEGYTFKIEILMNADDAIKYMFG